MEGHPLSLFDSLQGPFRTGNRVTATPMPQGQKDEGKVLVPNQSLPQGERHQASSRLHTEPDRSAASPHERTSRSIP
jgi:hypothetical protein